MPTATADILHHDRDITLPDGSVVRCAAYGDPAGHPVLALHGTPACRLMYAIADDTARRHGLHIVAPDRPGYGGTPLLTGRTLSVTGYADDIARIADAFGFERFALAGISGGGAYAAAAAARLGARITALALVSPLGPLADLPPDATLTPAQRWFFLRLAKWPKVTRAGAAAFRQMFIAAPGMTAALFRAAVGKADAAVLRRPDAAAAMQVLTREAFRQSAVAPTQDHAAFATPWAADLGAIKAPAVMWLGTDDRIVPLQASRHLCRAIPGCRLITLEGAGHFWVLTHAEEIMAELAVMLASSPDTPATDA